MRKYFDSLLAHPLFQGIEQEDLENMLQCLDARSREYGESDMIFLSGDTAKRIGLVLDGEAQVQRYDIMGNRFIQAVLAAGDLFGETFACAGVDTLPVSVAAVSRCLVLLMDYQKIITTCQSSCVFHNRLIENMLRILAQKNLFLNRRLEAVSARNIRQKLLIYLMEQAGQARSRKFVIPLNRQELADYLAVDRSALSRELGLMQQEGVLRYSRNRFELLEYAQDNL